MKKTLVYLILGLLFSGACLSLNASAGEVSLPADISISSGDGLPPELREFLGHWTGEWDPGPKQVVVVEKIDPAKGEITLVGANSDWQQVKASHTRYTAELSKDQQKGLVFRVPAKTGGAVSTFWMEKGSLRGKREVPGGRVSYIDMKRKE